MGRPLQPRRLPKRSTIFGPPPEVTRSRIIARYARMNDQNTFPLYCSGHPTDEQGIQTKVIYDTVEKARQCAIDLVHVGNNKLWPYECRRTDDRHAHLTHKKRGHDVQELLGDVVVGPRMNILEHHNA